MKLLILEDNEDIATLLVETFRGLGHDVTHCENGALGLEQITQSDFDAIVSDVSMPEMDGLTFAITARSNGVRTPIYLYTGNPTLDAEKVKQGLINGVFNKVEVDRLIKAVESEAK